MARYLIDEAYLRKYRNEIEQGQPVIVEVRDLEQVGWLAVKAILSNSPLEGGEKVKGWNFIGSTPTGQELYIKILEELPEEAVRPTAREPTADGRPKI